MGALFDRVFFFMNIFVKLKINYQPSTKVCLFQLLLSLSTSYQVRLRIKKTFCVETVRRRMTAENDRIINDIERQNVIVAD